MADEMHDIVFVCVAFGDQRYLQQQVRLKHSIREIYPYANLQFYTDALPPNSRSMWDSLYGFKVYAVAEARKTYSKVIFLDPAMVLVGKIDRLLNFPLVACKDESRLSQTICDKYLEVCGMKREDIERFGWNLVGGSLYYFDFSHEITRKVFEDWADDERAGCFGSQVEQASEQINGHRNDETCMAMALYSNGLKPNSHDEVGYCTENSPMFKKYHFK